MQGVARGLGRQGRMHETEYLEMKKQKEVHNRKGIGGWWVNGCHVRPHKRGDRLQGGFQDEGQIKSEFTIIY
jgi:hypothetical protein